jgi:hypothetical protein
MGLLNISPVSKKHALILGKHEGAGTARKSAKITHVGRMCNQYPVQLMLGKSSL